MIFLIAKAKYHPYVTKPSYTNRCLTSAKKMFSSFLLLNPSVFFLSKIFVYCCKLDENLSNSSVTSHLFYFINNGVFYGIIFN